MPSIGEFYHFWRRTPTCQILLDTKGPVKKKWTKAGERLIRFEQARSTPLPTINPCFWHAKSFGKKSQNPGGEDRVWASKTCLPFLQLTWHLWGGTLGRSGLGQKRTNPASGLVVLEGRPVRPHLAAVLVGGDLQISRPSHQRQGPLGDLQQQLQLLNGATKAMLVPAVSSFPPFGPSKSGDRFRCSTTSVSCWYPRLRTTCKSPKWS